MSDSSSSKPKHNKVMNILAEVTGGKSYKAHKYGLDQADRPSVDYGDSEIVVEAKSGNYAAQDICRSIRAEQETCFL